MDTACLCIQCGKHFKTVRTLTQHQKIHSYLRPHVCEVCNKSFVRKDTLQEHVKAHDPSKSNYVCQECGKMFGRRFSLQAYVMHHTPENRFACTMCGKTHLTKSNLERHKETHGPKEKWAGTSTSRSRNVSRHVHILFYSEGLAQTRVLSHQSGHKIRKVNADWILEYLHRIKKVLIRGTAIVQLIHTFFLEYTESRISRNTVNVIDVNMHLRFVCTILCHINHHEPARII